MNSTHFYGVSAFFNAIFGLSLVYTVYLRNRTNPLNKSFLYLGIAITGWCLIYALWSWADNARMAEFYLRRHMMFEAFINATFIHFVCEFTHCYKKFKKWILLNYALSAVYSVLMLTPAMIAGVREILFFKYWPAPGWLLPSHVVQFCVVIPLAYGLLIRYFFQSSGIEKRKAFILLLAFGIGFGGGSINWLLWFDIPVPPTTNFFVGVMFVLTAYAMIRYGMMDMDQVLELMRSSRASTLGLWASSLNHELRNPLYIAKGRIDAHLEAVAEQRLSPEMELQKSREVLESSHKQLERAMKTMERFSNFLKPQPQSHGAQEPVPFKEIMDHVLGFAAEELALNHIQVKIQETEIALRGEREQFEEILFNLVMNACHAIKQTAASGTIEVLAEQRGNAIRIQVTDSGPGIPEENQRYLFEPFFTTKGSKGTGLGLYITKQLAERNGGKISVKSKPGKGTTFVLEFKL